MNKILILFAHPRFEKSRVNRALLRGVDQIPQVTLHDLYEQYPDFNVDIEQEQELMTAHEIIIWQHPFYMYGAPALLKQWIDLVLEYGWAHGRGGDFLKGKIIFNALTSGGSREVYATNGYNRFTLREFLVPFDQTATLCKMIYLPPFAVQGTHLLTETQLAHHASVYHSLLERLSQGDFSLELMREFPLLNDWLDHDTGAPDV
ncbi:MAG: NAD(P)H-dependent oxidoreductase [Syntrophales bacterium]|nr:NAD(P)H-dependent oxidoreductase [Syntrophales bacterium]